MVLTCGDTFLIPKSSDDTEHLWIVITPPEADTARAVCVNVTTKQSYSETTVILRPADHPFIQHESVIFYKDAQILDLNRVEQALNAGIMNLVCKPHAPCSEELLKRIQAGMLQSKQLKKEVKEELFWIPAF